MRRRLLAVCAVAALAGWHLALRASAWRLPLVIDEGEYAYAAGVWARGGLPYRDASCQKPPLILCLYRAGLALGGPERGPRALGILASLLTAALLALAAPRSFGAAARAAPAAAFAALSTLPVGDYSVPANTETLVCLFLAGAAAALSRERAGLAGLLCGAALLSKQTALFSVLAFGLVAAWTGERRLEARRAASFAAGAAAVPLLCAAYFAARGGLADLWRDAFTGNLSYASAVGAEGLFEQARWLAGWLGPKLLAGFWPALALAGYGLADLEARRSQRQAVLAVLWLGTALAGLMIGFFFFPHYFLAAAAPLSLCAGWGVEKLRRRAGPKAAWAAAAGLAVLPALAAPRAYAERDPERLAKRLLYPNPIVEDRRMGEFIGARTTPADTIYVYGSEPSIYVYARRRAATPTSFAYMLTLRRPRPGAVDEELERLRAARPRYVVYSRQPLSALIAHREGLRYRDEIREWLRAEYKPVLELPIERDAAAAERPVTAADFTPADSLLLLERAR
jgi:hypothetical protein